MFPRWVLLEESCGDLAEGSCSAADAATTAAACLTSSGQPIRVSVRVAAAPEESQICVQTNKERAYACVVAAHSDSVLINVGFRGGYGYGCSLEDYFVYSAGAPPRPPSLLLLPSPWYVDENEPEGSLLSMDLHDTGLMRTGAGKDDDLIVASLQIDTVAVSDDGDDYAAAAPSKTAKLHLLRRGEWSVKQPKFIDCEGQDRVLLSSWRNHAVVSADDGLMYWVDFRRGLIFCDVSDDTPVLGYVQLPADEEEVDPLSCRGPNRNVCVTSDGVVKFVHVQPRCCCGSSGGTHCRHSANAYTIRIWTLKMDAMVWEMDSLIDATEIWALDAYKSLPRVQLAYPIVSMDEPHIIFFIICESFYARKHGDKTEWLVLVDTRSKTIRSVYRYDKGSGYFRGRIFFPSSVSDYFNSSPSCSRDSSSSVRKTSRESKPPPPVIANDEHFTDNNGSISKEASREETILAALQEIPGLARDEMLKGYNILGHDRSGRRFRSLLGLPMNLRKDWLLMEIKTSEACPVCYACATNSQHG